MANGIFLYKATCALVGDVFPVMSTCGMAFDSRTGERLDTTWGHPKLEPITQEEFNALCDACGIPE